MKTGLVCYENFPWHIVLISNSVALLNYVFGSLIMAAAGLIPLVLYLALLIILEIRLLAVSCTKCCYYGKICAFGKGKIAALFFKQGDPSLFISKNVAWYSIIPDMLVLILPLLTGILLLVRDFSLIILVFMLLQIALSTFGNGYVRTTHACRYCKQRVLGCPAEKLFSKKE